MFARLPTEKRLVHRESNICNEDPLETKQSPARRERAKRRADRRHRRPSYHNGRYRTLRSGLFLTLHPALRDIVLPLDPMVTLGRALAVALPRKEGVGKGGARSARVETRIQRVPLTGGCALRV